MMSKKKQNLFKKNSLKDVVELIFKKREFQKKNLSNMFGY